MFSFLKNKVNLADAVNDFVDIHNHILPGIDDGAATVEDSISLIQKFVELGVTEFIATPHVMNDYYPNTPETINNALSKVKSSLQEAGLQQVRIKAAAEYMMDQSFLELLEEGELLTLAENYVLVEMSYFQAPINLNNILFQLQTKRYKPVLAHPERYVYYHSKGLEKYEELKSRGCYFQLNLLSVTGHYGKNIQKVAFNLLENDMIDFVGSDAHQLRHLEKLSQSKIYEEQMNALHKALNNTRSAFKNSFSQTSG